MLDDVSMTSAINQGLPTVIWETGKIDLPAPPQAAGRHVWSIEVLLGGTRPRSVSAIVMFDGEDGPAELYRVDPEVVDSLRDVVGLQNLIAARRRKHASRNVVIAVAARRGPSCMAPEGARTAPASVRSVGVDVPGADSANTARPLRTWVTSPRLFVSGRPRRHRAGSREAHDEVVTSSVRCSSSTQRAGLARGARPGARGRHRGRGSPGRRRGGHLRPRQADSGRIDVYRGRYVVDEIEDPMVEVTVTRRARPRTTPRRRRDRDRAARRRALRPHRCRDGEADHPAAHPRGRARPGLRPVREPRGGAAHRLRQPRRAAGDHPRRRQGRGGDPRDQRAEPARALPDRPAREGLRPRGAPVGARPADPRLPDRQGFLKRLFELEVPEIHAGTVEVKAIAREAGSRSKVAVSSRQEGLDPVGATVGQRGARVQAVVAELAGEKIDVIPWNEDPSVFVANALSPAQVLGVKIDTEHRIANVTVPERMLSLAIGREGQNARLAARLTGWRIDIRSDVAAESPDADLPGPTVPTRSRSRRRRSRETVPRPRRRGRPVVAEAAAVEARVEAAPAEAAPRERTSAASPPSARRARRGGRAPPNPRRRPWPRPPSPSGPGRPRSTRRCRRSPGGRADPAHTAAAAPDPELRRVPHRAAQARARADRAGARRYDRGRPDGPRARSRRLPVPGRVLLGRGGPQAGPRARAQGIHPRGRRGRPRGGTRRPDHHNHPRRRTVAGHHHRH